MVLNLLVATLLRVPYQIHCIQDIYIMNHNSNNADNFMVVHSTTWNCKGS